MVCALGLERQLVAISHECDYPPDVLDRPRVTRARFDPAGLDSAAVDAAVREALARDGSVYEVDEAGLRAARPDLILTQGVCEVCAVPVTLAEQAACAIGGDARVLSVDAHSVEEILASIVEVARAAGREGDGVRVATGLRDRMDAVRRRVAGAPRPTVLAVEWLEPVFVPGHWVPEMVTLAGGNLPMGRADRPSEAVTWNDLMGLDPDVLIVMPCGFGLARSRAEAGAFAERLRAAAPRAVAGGRAWVVDGSSYFNRSGPRVADGVEILGRILHPDRVSGVQLTGRAEVWRG
jgi:iron complex transport system substrate-binding protein